MGDESQDSPVDWDTITLIVQGTSIPCSKSLLTSSSPYFTAMFHGSFAEASARVVTIHEVTASSLQAIVERLRKGRSGVQINGAANGDSDGRRSSRTGSEGGFHWDALDSLDILYTASVLQFDQIQEECIQYISDNLNTHSCLSVMLRAEQLGLEALYDAAHLQSQWAFETIIQDSSFIKLPYDEVSRYLGENLLVSSEEKVIEAICTWVGDDERRKKRLGDLLQHVEYSALSFADLLRHSYHLMTYSLLFNYEPPLLKTFVSYLKHFSSSLWSRAQTGVKIEETPLAAIEDRRDIPAKVYVVATGIRRYPESHINSKLRMSNPPEDYLQSKLYYLCPDHMTLKLSSVNNDLQRKDIGTAVKIFPVESEVWVVASKEETVAHPVFSFWKFNTVLQRWVYVADLPSHIRDMLDWLVYVRNHIYILYEPFVQKTERVMDVYNVVKKQWTRVELPLDLKSLERDKSMFFAYQDHLYIISSWFEEGISLKVSSNSDEDRGCPRTISKDMYGGTTLSRARSSRSTLSCTFTVDEKSRSTRNKDRSDQQRNPTREDKETSPTSDYPGCQQVPVPKRRTDVDSETSSTQHEHHTGGDGGSSEDRCGPSEISKEFPGRSSCVANAEIRSFGMHGTKLNEESIALEDEYHKHVFKGMVGKTSFVEWKRMTWCSYKKQVEQPILHCVVDKADLYAFSFSGLFKLDVHGEQVLRCQFISEYMYGDLHNDHDLCFRIFSKTVQVMAGKVYCWRKAESGHLSIFDVAKRKQKDTDLQYESSSGTLEHRWHGFHIVLDSCFVLPDSVDPFSVEQDRE